MKQIFDSLRENIKANSVDLYSLEIIGKDRALALVDESEAKWEADCCIRVIGKPFTSSCGQKYDKWLYVGESYCSKCGKPIKIVEVE